MHEQPCTCRESRTRFPVSRASPWRIQASLVYRQTFDHFYFPIEGGCSAKGYDREKRGGLTGGMKGSKEGRRRRRRKEGRRSKRSAESGGTRGIIRPSTPQAHPLPPLFSYPLHTLPRATPLDHSRHSSYLPPSSALHLSLFSLSLVPSTLFLALRHSLLHAMPRLHAYRQMGLLTSLAANVHAVQNYC